MSSFHLVVADPPLAPPPFAFLKSLSIDVEGGVLLLDSWGGVPGRSRGYVRLPLRFFASAHLDMNMHMRMQVYMYICQPVEHSPINLKEACRRNLGPNM